MKAKFKISKELALSEFSKPYVIAEIGVNHECSVSKAKKLILQAKSSGAAAVKFQTYKADTIASKDAKAYWNTNEESTLNQFDLFNKFDKFEKKDYIKLYKYCKKIKIDFLSTPFDLDAVDILKPLVKFFKISSSDITNFPLIIKIAKTNKPILLSTGASTINEIQEAIKLIKKYNNKDVAIMHCILNYPTANKDANLSMIKSLKYRFPENLVGYSDHTLPDSNMTNLQIAYSLGAIIIEKHFTDNKNKKGNDHYHSMDKRDLKIFIKKSNYIFETLGKIHNKRYISSEKISRKNARRSIVINRDMIKGDKISKKDIICKRPATGIEPRYFDKIVKYKLKKNLQKNSVLKWSFLQKNSK